MSVKSANARIIFGLKVRQLRSAGELSLKELAEQAGMSVSYLNEIEKGKKYPKGEKIKALAAALKVTEKELTSLELKSGLAPVGELLHSNFLNELPLELFGIELSKVIEIIANAPKRVGAFISTLVDLSRNYELREDHFYFGALRSYLEMHNNFFEEIEVAVQKFRSNYKLSSDEALSVNFLQDLLVQQFDYTIVPGGLTDYPDLEDVRSVFLPEKRHLLLNDSLTDMQLAFQMGKELGFEYLKLKERALTSSLLQVNSFEEVLSHFKAGYFSAALLLDRQAIIKDLKLLFAKDKWDNQLFLQLLDKYLVTPETLMQRMTNLLPEDLGIQKLFFLRFVSTPSEGHFRIDKELHLDQQHQPHGNGLFEHYCRRWISIALLKDLPTLQKDQGEQIKVGVQLSRYHETEDTYLCITIARPAYPSPEKNVSVTLGILVDEAAMQRINFLNDPSIQRRVVNKTCERCSILDCKERVAQPKVIESREKRRNIQQALQQLVDADQSLAISES